MLLIREKIKEINTFLEVKKTANLVEDYRIRQDLRGSIDVFVKNVATNTEQGLAEEIQAITAKTSVVFLSSEEIQDDYLYSSLFSKENKIDWGLRRRLDNLIELGNAYSYEKPKDLAPIITFFSYKGGVGRTTTLITFAAHFAYQQKKKVVVLDCDFEAPGITNFLGVEESNLQQQNGIVEYLNDRVFVENPQDLNLENYYIEAPSDFTGEGNVFLFPAGNLFGSEDKGFISENSHAYLEGLARLDASNTEGFTTQFAAFLQHIQNGLNPDLILIDSRTGFTDTFGIIGLEFSDILIGFFGSNHQTKPGLRYFMELAQRSNNASVPILVNSIIPYSDFFDNFTETVKHFQDFADENEDSKLNFERFSITRYAPLERLGTNPEKKSNYQDHKRIIQQGLFPDYNQIFAHLTERVLEKKQTEKYQESVKQITEEQTENIIESERIEDIKVEEIPDFTILTQPQLRKWIATQVHNNLPTNYAEEENVVEDDELKHLDNEEFIEKKFYFRNEFNSIFLKQKFIVLGGKGTGKTFFYEALRKNVFLEKLKHRANKPNNKYEVLACFDSENKHGGNSIAVDSLFSASDSDVFADAEYFFHRFWKIIAWNTLSERYKNETKLLSNLERIDLSQASTQTAVIKNQFKTYIQDQNFGKIELDLIIINRYLQQKDIKVLLLHDYLDKVVKPVKWDICIAPLIKVWRHNHFTNIQPKLFIRRDLYNRLGNLNNKNELLSNHINLEWTKEAVFSLFFKRVLAYTKEAFLQFMQKNGEPGHVIDTYDSYSEINLFQVSESSDELEPLVRTFFGKYADTNDPFNSRYGTPYDWFFENLQNADGTISIRPFVDLLTVSLKELLGMPLPPLKDSAKYKRVLQTPYANTILSANYYAWPNHRRYAVDRHFNDLAKEEGNKDLLYFYNYISDPSKCSQKFRKDILGQVVFEELLMKIIENEPNIENKNVALFKKLLLDNGIVRERSVTGGRQIYVFALLYKYYFGLYLNNYEEN